MSSDSLNKKPYITKIETLIARRESIIAERQARGIPVEPECIYAVLERAEERDRQFLKRLREKLGTIATTEPFNEKDFSLHVEFIKEFEKLFSCHNSNNPD